tara:strand:+ start:187 stop:711 length:525 start_codon:yes stop_codon:yes gene_type:complete
MTNTIFIFFCGYLLGLFFPDFDFYFIETLGHRSIIFHSIFLPLIFLIFSKKENLYVEVYISGVFYGISVHLIADIFPLIWNENTFVKLPKDLIILSKYSSLLWLLLNSIIGFIISLNYLKKFDKFFFYSTKFEIIGFLSSLIYITLHASNYIKVIIILLVTISLIKIYHFLTKK